MKWPVRPLSAVAEVRLGRQRAPKNHSGDSMRPYIRAANVTWAGLNLNDVKSMNFTDEELDTYRLQPGDIVLGEASGSPGEVGKPALWSGEIADCAFQNTLIRVRPREHEPKFLLHYFRYQALTGRFIEHSRGVGIHHLGRARLASWPTPVPPLDEQRRIVDLLEDHLSRLDAAEAYMDNGFRRIEAMRGSVLASLYTGDRSQLRTLAVDAGYGTSTKCSADGTGIPVVRIPNLVNGCIDLSDEKRVVESDMNMTKYLLSPGDVLIVRTNGSVDLIGRSAVVQSGIDAAFASYLIRYRVRNELVRPQWVHAMLRSPQIRARIVALAASSAGQHNLSLAKLDSLELPVPSLAVQDAGLAHLTEIEGEMSRLANTLAATRTRARTLRSSLLAFAFGGRLIRQSRFRGG
ncbi:restriction endonuclease subunit S [Mycobacterium hubeiense]|uniref:restriction endonuclease subunit S n=1 Tax=Mycobacterium hubeiense TaxID=1867256 RepID=UPI00115BB616|nr:restriction endonuclease subunit S [Mycobacterium sp. QGD 101]